MRNLVIVICLVLMCILGWFYCQSAQECCGDGLSDDSAAKTQLEKTPTDSAEEEAMSKSLMFNWSDVEPILNDQWDKYRADLIANLKDGESLEITGLYRAGEVNNTTFDNLGSARAGQLKQLISPPIEEGRITLNSKLAMVAVDRNKPFNSAEFRNYRPSASIDESIPNRTIIRFPSNSTNKLSNRDIEIYLDKVADRIKTSGERVRITGHTDNIGNNASNISIGRRRAEFIKNYLVNRGALASKITTESKGESVPVADNGTDVGRAQNRRAELEIIK